MLSRRFLDIHNFLIVRAKHLVFSNPRQLFGYFLGIKILKIKKFLFLEYDPLKTAPLRVKNSAVLTVGNFVAS